ncbi:MAG: DUF3365 domain-containing protein [Myxococcales bacterium]|nr:DUF3365 domain-containing protein [Myxococcales bacterium]
MRRRSPPRTSLAFAFAFVCSSWACRGAEEPEASAPPVPASPTARPIEVRPSHDWQVVYEPSMTPEQRERLEKAKAAKSKLASRLMEELSSAVSEGNFARGVEVCRDTAPKVAREVSTDLDIEIGRTSFKVRNPKNRPEGWRARMVEARPTDDVVLAGPGGAVGYFSPIRLAEPCVACHGTNEQMASPVKEILASAYPEDEATGFAPGDLRGWFWVEVSGPAAN